MHFEDGRRFVKFAPGPYDVVMVNLPDPTTVVVNRFYTREFFTEVERILSPNGIFTFALESPHLKLYGERRLLHRVLYAQLRERFAGVLFVPGFQTRYLACRAPGVLTSEPDVLARRLEERGIETREFSRFVIEDLLNPFRRDILAASLVQEPSESRAVNLDFHPLCAFAALTLWVRQYGEAGGALLRLAGRATGYAVLLPLVAAAVVALWWRRPGLPRFALPLIVAIAGFLGMGGQMVVLIGFQAVAGYLFYQIGLLMTVFMLGLTCGALLVRRSRSPALLIAVLAGLGLATLLMPLVLREAASRPQLVSWLLGTVSAVLGLLDGATFPLIVSLVEARHSRAAAALYAADLGGAAVGGLLAATVAIPLHGLFYTCLLLAAGAACALLLGLPLLRARPGRPQTRQNTW